MKQILLSVLLTIVAAAPALAQSESKAAPSKRSVEGQLIDLERQLSEALVRENAAVLRSRPPARSGLQTATPGTPEVAPRWRGRRGD